MCFLVDRGKIIARGQQMGGALRRSSAPLTSECIIRKWFMNMMFMFYVQHLFVGYHTVWNTSGGGGGEHGGEGGGGGGLQIGGYSGWTPKSKVTGIHARLFSTLNGLLINILQYNNYVTTKKN